MSACDQPPEVSFLGFQEDDHFQLAAIPPGRPPVCQTFSFAERAKAKAWVAERDGKANLYVCTGAVAARQSGKASESDITRASAQLIDVDPADWSKDSEVTEELKQALRADAEAVSGWIAKVAGVSPGLVFSGRGYQLLLLPPNSHTKEERKQVQEAAKGLVSEASKIDGTANSDRLCRLPGTVNLKSDQRAELIRPPEARMSGEEWAALLSACPESPEPSGASVELPSDLTMQTKDWALVSSVQFVRDRWDKQPEDRSTNDFANALQLFWRGAFEDQVARVLANLPHGKFKATGRLDYLQRTVEKAKSHFETELRQVHEDSHEAGWKAELALGLARLNGNHEEERLLSSRLRDAGVDLKDVEKNLITTLLPRPLVLPPGVETLVRAVTDGEAGSKIWFEERTQAGWKSATQREAEERLRATGFKPPKRICVALREDPFVLVNVPFMPEYLDRRQWNRSAAQFVREPAAGPCPTFDMVVSHLAEGLNDAVQQDERCRALGITNGADWLWQWLGHLFQKPSARLPMLAFFGPKNAGKSTLWEAIGRSLTRGVVWAETALTGSFTGELDSAVLCLLEEVDLGGRKGVSAKLKALTTADKISIHPKGKTPFMQENTTHWVHCANSPAYVALEYDDTRTVLIKVEQPHQVEADVPERLRAEIPQFIHKVLNHKLVRDPTSRLHLPVVETNEKRRQMRGSRSELDRWIADNPQFIFMSLEDIAGAVSRAGGDKVQPGRIERSLNATQAAAQAIGVQLGKGTSFSGTASEAVSHFGLGEDVTPQVAGQALALIEEAQGSHLGRLVVTAKDRESGKPTIWSLKVSG